MYIFKNKLLYIIVLVICVTSHGCYRNEIEFGDNPDNSYTRLVYIDTVQTDISTVLIDSFVTNSAASFLLGKYTDPYLGIISAKPYFQLTVPATTIGSEVTDVYDSATFIIHLDKYYYGDTSRSQTIHVNELAETIAYSYNEHLFNTSSIPVKRSELGSRTMKISPGGTDSIIIRLNDTKGLELFNKMKEKSTDVANEANFLSYFNGISLSVNDNDTTAVYGLSGVAGALELRIHYHSTIPYLENKFIEFTSLANAFSFNQILTDRRNTLLYTPFTGEIVFPSSQTNNLAFTQFGAGLLMKMTFPSFKNIIKTDKIIKLKKAELVIRPLSYSFDRYRYKLPSQVYLSQTNGTNVAGDPILDSLGSGVQLAAPVTDEIYGLDNYYRFNITSYIDNLLTTTGTNDYGFYLMQNTSGTSPRVDRIVIGNNGNYKLQLLLTVVVIDK